AVNNRSRDNGSACFPRELIARPASGTKPSHARQSKPRPRQPARWPSHDTRLAEPRSHQRALGITPAFRSLASTLALRSPWRYVQTPEHFVKSRKDRRAETETAAIP